MKRLILLLLTLVMLDACGAGKSSDQALVPNNTGTSQQLEQPSSPAPSLFINPSTTPITPSPTPSFNRAELSLSSKAKQGDFELAIYTSKTEYEVDELIEVYAELTYVGEKEQIEIGHSMYPVGFDISEHTRGLFIMGAMEEPYIVTTLKRNEPVRYEYSFSGGHSSNDSKDYIAFVKALADNKLPQGEYTISAYADFNEHISDENQSVQNNDAEPVPSYRFSTAISFVVDAL